tara:strand:+ start:332 stop:655 length:324 start_codon:yes stop_codon:yes gene_type:complete
MGLRMEEFTISDLAQAVVLGLGAMGSLLLVVWQSRCLCRCRIGLGDQCYLFDCSREPPPIQEEEKEEEVVPEKKTIKKNESWENVTEPLTPSSERNEPEPEMNQDVP